MNIYKNVTLKTTVLKTGNAIVDITYEDGSRTTQVGIREFADYEDEVMRQNNQEAFDYNIVVDNYNNVYVVWGDAEACEMYITQLHK